MTDDAVIMALSDHRAPFGFSGECLGQEARNPGANPKGGKEGRRTDSDSHPRGVVARFNLVTQQDMELRTISIGFSMLSLCAIG